MRGEFLGFDLSEVNRAALEHQKLLDSKWHLRKERIICYQLTVLISIAAQISGNVSLFTAAWVHNKDIKTATSLSLACCVLIAVLFGVDAFLIIFWPRRRYPDWLYNAKRMMCLLITAGTAAAATVITITVVTHLTGPDDAAHRFPYHMYTENKVWVGTLWMAFLGTTVASSLMLTSITHDVKYGTDSKDLGSAPDSSNGTEERDIETLSSGKIEE